MNYPGAVLREQFLFGLVAVAVNSGQAQRGIDDCDHNTVLPYGRPLEIKMRVLDGPDFVLSKYDGLGVWINCFATWCEPCHKEQPFIVRSAKERYDAGLRVIGIDFKETDDQVRAYRAKYDIPYPIAMDQQGGFTYALETGATEETIHFPVHLFITPKGYLDCYVIGTMSDEEITHKLDRISASVPAPRPASGQ